MSDRKTIDPRIKLTLLPIASFTSFFISDTILLFGLIVFAFFLYVYSGMGKRALRFILFFLLLYCIELGLEKFCKASFVFGNIHVYLLCIKNDLNRYVWWIYNKDYKRK